MHSKIILLLFILLFTLSAQDINCQKLDQVFLQELKEDRRGPYAGIKWFCEDGSMREARDPCPEPMKGWQHAIYKYSVERISEQQHIFLDQILTGTEKDDFWDMTHQNSRLKQYQITNFLFDADDGWILRQAKNYRGAKQIEDEKDWGQEFLQWLVSDPKRLEENYLLIKLAAVDIPHGEDTRIAQKVRAYSKLLAEEEENFMNARIKIHNNPNSYDVEMVKSWRTKNEKISAKAKTYYSELIEGLSEMYKPMEIVDLEQNLTSLSSSDFSKILKLRIKNLKGSGPALRSIEACELLPLIRENIVIEKNSKARLGLIDLANQLESMAIKNLHSIEEKNLGDIREKICFLTEGLYGAGYLENWEYNKIKQDFDWMQDDRISMEDMEYFKYASQKLVQWSSQMIQSLYAEPVQEFGKFEPISYGFVDHKIRSSLILPLGKLVEAINEIYNQVSENTSIVMGSKNDAGLQGLNPGLALGKLHVLSTLPEDMDIDAKGIYAFDRPPTEMKPVAGILNVKEGNPVSHVQLLARNLGIPNALISSNVLNKLDKYNGKEVFYAVSPGGTILLKLAKDMTKEEKKIFTKKDKNKKKVTIAMDKIILHPDSLLDLSRIDASFSGKWCGPKAANLGQLKLMFPNHVVDGIVLPFGIFRDHMEQIIPDSELSYWEYLTSIFAHEKEKLSEGRDKKQVETETLAELTNLRSLIEKMPLKNSLVRRIEDSFVSVLGEKIGDIPIFLRSDTNMEDLPQFTGAGLNLTLFNVVDRQEILQGIKKVWASPYTERSYQWRQQYLENPEEVYPSILIIPSVNVDRSGVIITKGVSRGSDQDISISFSRGVGGAVEGQSAESYVIYNNGYAELISPGRETKYRTIPPSGGSTFRYASFREPVVNPEQLIQLEKMANCIADKMDQLGSTHQAYDIELGIKDNFIWLFQVRPFVENNDALGSSYLRNLDPVVKDISILMEPQN